MRYLTPLRAPFELLENFWNFWGQATKNHPKSGSNNGFQIPETLAPSQISD
jgi:hypothetical protein